MPRPSKNRHVVARLRQELDIHQKDLADWVGCSRALIQAVEIGQRRLTEALARDIADATGVALSWLLALDHNKVPVTVSGTPLTRDVCDRHRAWRHTGRATPEEVAQFEEFVRAHKLTMTLQGPATDKERRRRHAKGLLWTLGLQNQQGKVMKMPAWVNAPRVAKALQEKLDQVQAKQELMNRGLLLSERLWAALSLSMSFEDRALLLHRLERSFREAVRQQNLQVSKRLKKEHAETLAAYFAEHASFKR